MNDSMSTLSSMKDYSNAHATVMQHSTPVSPSQGSTYNDVPYKSACIIDPSLPEPDPDCMEMQEDENFEVFLTNIDGSVTEKDVSKMVS